jgi:glycosyltransferase involved in cell wall biosynthesis
MKIAVLHGSNDLYGASKVLVDQVTTLVALGHSVDVLVPTDGPLRHALTEVGAGVSLTVDPSLMVLRRSRLRDALRVPRLPALAHQADLVVVWTLAMALYVPLLQISRKRFYVAVHELLLGAAGAALVRCFLARGQFPISTCSRASSDWLHRCGVAPTRTSVVYPIVERPAITVPRDEISFETFTVAVVGRVNGHKGHLEVARAFREKLGSQSSWRLLVVGSPFPGQEAAAEAVKAIAEGDSRIRVLGEIDGFRSVATEVDLIACFPSKPEPFGLVPIEAWQHSIPSVGYADGGALEVLEMVGGMGVTRLEDHIDVIADALKASHLRWRSGWRLPAPETVQRILSRENQVLALSELIDHA